jgi:hypothetical protein
MVIGVAQTLFECSMYIFVLMYTPAIEDAIVNVTGDVTGSIALGYLFSTMMLAVMVGSLTFQVFERQAKLGPRCCMQFTEDRLLTMALGLASCAFMLMAYHGYTSVNIIMPYTDYKKLTSTFRLQFCYLLITYLNLQLVCITLLFHP